MVGCSSLEEKPPKGLEGSWLSVRNDKCFERTYDGYFMEVKKGQRIFQFAYSDSIYTDYCTFTDSSILTQDSSCILIKSIYKDSIQLLFEGDISVKYIKLPFKETEKINIQASDLIENSWFYMEGDHRHRIDFPEAEFSLQHCDKKLNLVFNLIGWNRYSGWDLMEYKNYTYFISTAWSIFEPNVYQVIGYKNDTISLMIWDKNGFKYPKLVKSPCNSQQERDELINQLVNNQFRVIDYHYEWGDSDSVFFNRIHHFFDEYGINRKMTFKFTDDSLFVFNSQHQYTKGAWSLSKDNQVIKVITANEPLDLFLIELKMDEKMHIYLSGYSNINKIYNGYQIDQLDLELIKE